MFATDDSFVSVQTVYPIPLLLKNLGQCVIEIGDSFFFLATWASSFMIMTLYFTMWVNKYSAKDSVYLHWFLLDRNPLRFSLHMAESVVREIQKTKRSVIVLFFLIFFL